jgi:uncharacterized RDD family membrane protein YckC
MELGTQVKAAPLGVRVLAAVLDSIVVFLSWLCIIKLWGDEGLDGGKVLTGIPAVLLMLATAAFWIFPEWLLGSTMGKWACDLKVTTLNGMSISFVQSLKRNVLRLLDFFPFYLPGFVAASLTPNRQRLGDLWAKTVVVPKKAAKQ